MQVNFDGLSKQKNKSEEIHLKNMTKAVGLLRCQTTFHYKVIKFTTHMHVQLVGYTSNKHVSVFYKNGLLIHLTEVMVLVAYIFHSQSRIFKI